MGLCNLLEPMRNHDRINAAAGQRDITTVKTYIGTGIIVDTEPPLTQRAGPFELASIESPAADLNAAIPGQPGQQLSKNVALVLHEQPPARTGQPLGR